MQIDENKIKLDIDNNNKKYKIVAIQNSMIYAKKSETDHHLLKFHYLILQKKYLEKKIFKNQFQLFNILKNLLALFIKKYLEKKIFKNYFQLFNILKNLLTFSIKTIKIN